MWKMFSEFAGEILREMWPAYFLLAILPVAGFTRETMTRWRALGLAALSQAGPFGMVTFAAAMSGESPAAEGVVDVHAMIGLGGLLLVIIMWLRLRKDLPGWATLPFFVGVAIINFMTMLLTGMSLTHDSL